MWVWVCVCVGGGGGGQGRLIIREIIFSNWKQYICFKSSPFEVGGKILIPLSDLLWLCIRSHNIHIKICQLQCVFLKTKMSLLFKFNTVSPMLVWKSYKNLIISKACPNDTSTAVSRYCAQETDINTTQLSCVDLDNEIKVTKSNINKLYSLFHDASLQV